jgi:uncharacterized protein YlaI
MNENIEPREKETSETKDTQNNVKKTFMCTVCKERNNELPIYSSHKSNLRIITTIYYFI